MRCGGGYRAAMLRRHICILACSSLLFAACSSIRGNLTKQILQPPGIWLAEPSDFGIAAEPFDIELDSDASLTGWWIPHEAAAGRTVVLLHDEATNISALFPYYTFLHEAGFQVLAFDPRGFGMSQGTPTLRAWLYDLNTVFDWLHERDDVDRDKIALFGTSWGSVAAIWAARMHRSCRAIVLEHLPSLRDMLRESTNDDGSALSAYRIGVIEFTLPENLEPSDNAPRTKAQALFVATEKELDRDRLSLLRTYEAYAGDKCLWVLPDTGRAPHAMLTYDENYRHGIVNFLEDAFARQPHGIHATVRKERNASDGEAWYEIKLELARGGDSEPWAVEACALLDDGSPRYARTWVEGDRGSVRIKLPSMPAHVTGMRVFETSEATEAAFAPKRSHLSRSGAAVADLWPRIEELRNDVISRADCRELARSLQAAAAVEPFHPSLQAELADVYARIGIELADDPDSREEAIIWLERGIAAVPARPELHFWPGPVPTYGFPYEDAIATAKRRLAQLQR